MQLSHENALSAALYFFHGIEIMDVFTLCLLQQMEAILSGANVSAERMQRLWEKSRLQAQGLLSSMRHYNGQIQASAEGAKGQ